MKTLIQILALALCLSLQNVEESYSDTRTVFVEQYAAELNVVAEHFFPQYLATMKDLFAEIYKVDVSQKATRDSLFADFKSKSIRFRGRVPSIFQKTKLSRFEVNTRESKIHRVLMASRIDTAYMVAADTTWPNPTPGIGSDLDYDTNPMYLDTLISLSLTTESVNRFLRDEGLKFYSEEDVLHLVELLFEIRNYVDEDMPLILLGSWATSVSDLSHEHAYANLGDKSAVATTIRDAFNDALSLLERISSKHNIKSLAPSVRTVPGGFDVEVYVRFYGSGVISRINLAWRDNSLEYVSQTPIGKSAY